MEAKRTFAYAPRTRALAIEMENLRGPCIGCKSCQGICAALIEAMLLPDFILRKHST